MKGGHVNFAPSAALLSDAAKRAKFSLTCQHIINTVTHLSGIDRSIRSLYETHVCNLLLPLQIIDVLNKSLSRFMLFLSE